MLESRFHFGFHARFQGPVLLVALLMLSGAAPAQTPSPNAKQDQGVGEEASLKTMEATDGLPALPALPSGRSTVMGGEIRDVDLVRDQFTLKVFGGRPVKILFDERTRIYRDGVAIALSDLRPEDHASVETALDGTDVFALRIHMLSGAPEGECQGQVTDYNSATGELTVRAVLSREPYVLKVSPKTSIERVGQNASASTQTSSTDLVKGSLVSVKFEAGSDARGIATDVSILATPGAAFAFGGNLSFLDLHAGRMVLLNAVDNTSYQISFDPAQFPQARDLHEGQNLNVTAIFDGSEYVANTMKIQSMVSSQAP